MSRNKRENGTKGWVHHFCLKQATVFLVMLSATLWAGCQKSADSPANANTAASLPDTSADRAQPPLPAGPQPKLQTVKLYLGPETLDAEMALTSDQEQTGLMYRTNITDETAMIFVLPGAMMPPNGFWMTNCPISLSAAYINPDGVIEEIHHLEKNDNVPVVATNNDIVYVLEVNDGWFTRHNINAGTLIRTERGSLTQTFR